MSTQEKVQGEVLESDFLQKRELLGYGSKIVFLIALAASIFHVLLIFTGVLESFKMRAIHLGFLLPLTFLLYPARKKSSRKRISIVDFAFFASSLISVLYLSVIEYDRFISRIAYIDQLSTLDIIVGVVLIASILEATRRVVGTALVIITCIALLYGLFGENLPGILAHAGFSFSRTIDHLVFTSQGIFGIPLGASATFIFLFVLFGEFLLRSGAGKFFIDLAFSLTGTSKGGPAKMAVLSSALMGTVSGSAVGNVASTGVYTIPLMRKVGYTRPFAGAVEAAASTGGQIMPPIMGAAAFIIAEFIGMPYINLALAALIPAILFYLGVLSMVHFQAGKMNLKGLPKEDLPDWKEVLFKRGHLAIPLAVIVVVLVYGYTPYVAAGLGLFSVLVVSFLSASTRMSVKDIVKAMSNGAQASIVIAVTCACAGIIVGIASQTGLGARFASIVISFSQDNLYIALPLVMIAAIILGMGIPTTAAYIMVAAIAVPALVQLDVLPLAAHLFALYFAVVSNITPPVAIAAYTAAGIAGARPMLTGVLAAKLGSAAFIVPYIFVFHNELLLVGEPVAIIVNIFTATLGIIALASVLIGYLFRDLKLWEKAALLIIATLLVIDSGYILTTLSCLTFGFIAFQQKKEQNYPDDKNEEIDPIENIK
ncbi:TRAP transporter permease [Oceanobacillus saliphilus]|uniref:TRAP transporter permease n=1 Tax=Oceanobacillus saliphilus TaxID=2925834 RepID=UPI00201DC0E2|nr:TRAP transporter permease [Oceanobacillus saliphilus]